MNNLVYDVWNNKYRQGNESLDEFFLRISKAFAEKDSFDPRDVDTKDLSDLGKKRMKSLSNTYKQEYFFDLFKDFKYIIPGGSVLSGVGTDKPVSLSNCYVIDTDDSIEDIFNTASNMSQIFKRRGGVGVDISKLRPRGSSVNNAAKTTTGVIPFMELFSQVTNTIGQEGRRGAMMISIDINHPDSPEFITSKQDLSKITGANISVRLSNEFMIAVENDEDYILRWPCYYPIKFIDKTEISEWDYNELIELTNDLGTQKAYVKKVKAKELWDSIIDSAWKSAEPGILFWNNIIDNDPASVYDKFKAMSTNPCGEIPLSPLDSCRLIAVNLYSLVKNPFKSNAYIDWNLASEIFYEAQIIGDILVDLELEHTQRIIDISEGREKELWKKINQIGYEGRRTGVGLLGLGDMFAALGVSYGHKEVLEDLMSFKQEHELMASIDLAILNNPFPAYRKNKEYNELGDPLNSFYKHLKDTHKKEYVRMREWGRRNISFSTIAPTGTISLLAGTSSGCEPVFSLYYTRRVKCNDGDTPDFVDQNGVGFKNYNVIHPKFQEWYSSEKGGGDLSTLNTEELDLLAMLSPWSENTAEEINPGVRVKTQSILQKYVTHSISSTVNLPENVSKETVSNIYINAWKQNLKGITIYRANSRSGILVKNEPEMPTKRPKELECTVDHFKNEKKQWLAIVGLYNKKPYEIFTGPKDIDIFPIPSSVTKGYIIKEYQEDGSSRYDFQYVDSYGYSNRLGGLSRVFDKEYWNYARLVSGYLRSGMPIEQVVKIVDGLTFTNKGMNNWKSGVIRALQPFIADGTMVIGEVCDNCGSSNIVYENGCKTCRDCLSSKCN